MSDLTWAQSGRYINLPKNPYANWGKYPELLKLTGFRGEVKRDMYSNIWGHFDGKTKGECIRGVIEDWEDYDYINNRWMGV